MRLGPTGIHTPTFDLLGTIKGRASALFHPPTIFPSYSHVNHPLPFHSPFSLQVISSLWDSSDASGHSGELDLVDALRVSVFFWFLVGGCLVLACLDLVPPLATDPRQSQESGLSVASDNFEHSLERRVWPLWGTRSASCYLGPGTLLAGSRR